MIITKLEAADRLIVNGVSMSLRGADPLAIHVVACSALNVLRDLIRHQGDDYTKWVLRQGLYSTAILHIKGEASSIDVDPKNAELISNVIKAVEAGEIKSPEEISINMDGKECRKMLDYLYTPYNFLKHADNDPNQTIDIGAFDAVAALINAITAFSRLCPEKPVSEEVATFLAKHGLA